MDELAYVFADTERRERLAAAFGERIRRYVRLDDGFTVVATCREMPVGLVRVSWRQLPPPIDGAVEAFVDIIEVRDDHRRRGIARQMIEVAAEEARRHGACQLRAWSSEDKAEAIPMWKALGFGLCPAIEHPRGQEVRGYFVARPL